jgi:hypothetical protein
LIVAATALAGCASAPTPTTSRDTPSAITIVGWSITDQAPIPVRGAVLQGPQTVLRFDTQAQPEGKTYSIAPGAYQVEVTQRLAGDRVILASGLERVDVRPGETVKCQVVVDDRDGGGPVPGESTR